MNKPLNKEILTLLDTICVNHLSTVVDVVMWLYYEHNIWISVSIIPYEKHVMFEYGICTIDESLYQDGVFNSPNEAYEAAIEYTLNNLI